MKVIGRIVEYFTSSFGYGGRRPEQFAVDTAEEAWRRNLIDPDRIEERIRLLSQRMW